jgi:serine/threonine-protein kinase
LGTPLYLSPEALVAPDTMDGRSDLYAVGALGYFLLTGAPPFSGSGLLEVCAHHLHTKPLPPSARRGSRIPPGLEALILACLAKTMDLRPPSAAALRDALLPFAAASLESRESGFWPREGESSWMGDLRLTACS